MMVCVLKWTESVSCPVAKPSTICFSCADVVTVVTKKVPCNFTARSQGGFLQVGGIVVHLTKKRASEGNSLSEY